MKKTIWIRLVVIVFSLSFIANIFGLIIISVLGSPEADRFANHVLNNLATVFLILNLVVSAVFLYKLIVFKKDILFWTNVKFSYALLYGLFLLVANIISNMRTMPLLLELFFIVLLWVLLGRHLKKILHKEQIHGSQNNLPRQ